VHLEALAAWARADSAATLSPEHPVNRALAEACAGTVARLLHADPRRRIATIACAPLRGRLDLPFGWHAIEDEAHLALFEPARQVQIQIGPVERRGRSEAAVLDALELELCGHRPAPGVLRLHHGGWHALALRECLDGRVPLEQYHLLAPGPDAAMLTHVRVLATPPRGAEAVGLAEALLAGLVFDAACAAAATNETRPGLR
jgi:hypothetical protein